MSQHLTVFWAPFPKGQVLNQLSAWWFEQLSDVVDNHVVELPDPNVMITHEAKPLPVEVIVRGYITGSTSTSLWTLYKNGVERPYGLTLPEGLVNNQRLPEPVITPTTKAEAVNMMNGSHPMRLSEGLVDPKLWSRVQEIALKIFSTGQRVAEVAGFILVDTKYEWHDR